MQVVRIAAAVVAFLVAVHGPRAGAATPPGPVSLQQSVQILEASNRALKLSRRQLDASVADVRRADVRPNPSLTAAISNTSARHYRPPDSDWIVRLEQLFERGGKRELRVAAARDLARAASLDIRETARQQRIVLAGAYFDLVAAQQALELANETAAGYLRLRTAAQRRLQAGDIAEVDVARLRVEEGRAQNEARTAAANVEQARVALAAVLGLEGTGEAFRATDDFLPLSQPLPDAAALERAIEQRADVSALRARIDALSQSRLLAIAQRTRDVTIGVQTERSPSLGGNVFGLSASIPLFVNNDFSGDIARADADLASAQEDLERVKGLVRTDAARAAAQVASALERAQRLEQTSLPEAARAAQAIDFAFSRGAATLTDLFDARRQLVAVRVEALSARADYSRAVLAWREAVHPEEVSR
ncbi:MAG TPA: TolC family protein [Burkholderiaceae bacterium]|nr:TolC family protein [Burkholderiaceae bacterium]